MVCIIFYFQRAQSYDRERSIQRNEVKTQLILSQLELLNQMIEMNDITEEDDNQGSSVHLIINEAAEHEEDLEDRVSSSKVVSDISIQEIMMIQQQPHLHYKVELS